jgi:hypothetical protein
MITLPLSYFGPIEEFVYLVKNNLICYESKEHFVKQSYRNRCIIYGANGLLRLTVPIVLKSREKTAMENIKISYAEDWQSHHWKSIKSAYKNSPFFDYYQEMLLPLFLEEFDTLKNLNLKTLEIVKECLQISCKTTLNKEFKPYMENDLRINIHPKKQPTLKLPRYIQVFEERHGFHQNLSILDLIFNEGPSSLLYLQNINMIQ